MVRRHRGGSRLSLGLRQRLRVRDQCSRTGRGQRTVGVGKLRAVYPFHGWGGLAGPRRGRAGQHRLGNRPLRGRGRRRWPQPRRPQARGPVHGRGRAAGPEPAGRPPAPTPQALPPRPPPVIVVTPNGGEDWTGGSAHAIAWTMDDAEDPTLTVTVDLSIDGGVTFMPLFGGSLPTGLASYPWPLPLVDTTTTLIRVCVLDSGGLSACDTSD